MRGHLCTSWAPLWQPVRSWVSLKCKQMSPINTVEQYGCYGGRSGIEPEGLCPHGNQSEVCFQIRKSLGRIANTLSRSTVSFEVTFWQGKNCWMKIRGSYRMEGWMIRREPVRCSLLHWLFSLVVEWWGHLTNLNLPKTAKLLWGNSISL